MGKTWIELSCIDQVLRLTNTPKVASGGVAEDYLRVTFCDKWDGFAKTAVFFRDDGDVYGMALNDAGECEIPHEVLATSGVLHFGVFGTKEGVTRTSAVVDYTIQEGAITSGFINTAEATQTILEQVMEMVMSKAPKDSPALTGTPTAPTAAAGTNTQQIATTAFVAAAIAALVDSAPETLDTLEELAEALGNDPNFATTVTNLIGQKAAQADLTSHTGNKTIHITAAERKAWNEHKADTTVHVTSEERTAWDAHKNDTAVHVTGDEKEAWNDHLEDTTVHITTDERTEWNNHKADTTVHITAAERTAWNAKQKKIVVGTTDPEEMTGLEVGDIYIYLEE